MDNPSLVIQSLGLIISIIVAVAFVTSVKGKIKAKEEFSGMGWGIANGIVGVGILWVLLAHSSIIREIEKIKDKKYKKFVEQEIKDFTKTYGICLVISLALSFFIASAFNH